jgi:small GTP-binding protein
MSTVGVDFKIKTLRQDGKVIKLQIWDTAGQERFRSITKSYYSGSHGVAVVYDVSNFESFKKVDFWMQEIERASGTEIHCKILIGNKSDLPDRQVTSEQGEELAKRYEIPFMETSAKDSTNVQDMFQAMITKILEEIQMKPSTTSIPEQLLTGKSVKLSGDKKPCC